MQEVTEYFRFGDVNHMSYRYVLYITYTKMGHENTHNPVHCSENKRESIGLAAC